MRHWYAHLIGLTKMLTHLLHRQSESLSALMPFLIIADVQNIVKTISRIVCERHILDIHVPVVGLCMSDDNSSVSVHCGWWSDSDGKVLIHPDIPDCKLDVPHAGDHQRHPLARGGFDLSNEASAMTFVEYLLGLKHHFEALQSSIHEALPSNIGINEWKRGVPAQFDP